MFYYKILAPGVEPIDQDQANLSLYLDKLETYLYHRSIQEIASQHNLNADQYLALQLMLDPDSNLASEALSDGTHFEIDEFNRIVASVKTIRIGVINEFALHRSILLQQHLSAIAQPQLAHHAAHSLVTAKLLIKYDVSPDILLVCYLRGCDLAFASSPLEILPEKDKQDNLIIERARRKRINALADILSGYRQPEQIGLLSHIVNVPTYLVLEDKAACYAYGKAVSHWLYEKVSGVPDISAEEVYSTIRELYCLTGALLETEGEFLIQKEAFPRYYDLSDKNQTKIIMRNIARGIFFVTPELADNVGYNRLAFRVRNLYYPYLEPEWEYQYRLAVLNGYGQLKPGLMSDPEIPFANRWQAIEKSWQRLETELLDTVQAMVDQLRKADVDLDSNYLADLSQHARMKQSYSVAIKLREDIPRLYQTLNSELPAGWEDNWPFILAHLAVIFDQEAIRIILAQEADIERAAEVIRERYLALGCHDNYRYPKSNGFRCHKLSLVAGEYNEPHQVHPLQLINLGINRIHENARFNDVLDLIDPCASIVRNLTEVIDQTWSLPHERRDKTNYHARHDLWCTIMLAIRSLAPLVEASNNTAIQNDYRSLLIDLMPIGFIELQILDQAQYRLNDYSSSGHVAYKIEGDGGGGSRPLRANQDPLFMTRYFLDNCRLHEVQLGISVESDSGSHIFYLSVPCGGINGKIASALGQTDRTAVSLGLHGITCDDLMINLAEYVPALYHTLVEAQGVERECILHNGNGSTTVYWIRVDQALTRDQLKLHLADQISDQTTKIVITDRRRYAVLVPETERDEVIKTSWRQHDQKLIQTIIPGCSPHHYPYEALPSWPRSSRNDRPLVQSSLLLLHNLGSDQQGYALVLPEKSDPRTLARTKFALVHKSVVGYTSLAAKLKFITAITTDDYATVIDIGAHKLEQLILDICTQHRITLSGKPLNLNLDLMYKELGFASKDEFLQAIYYFNNNTACTSDLQLIRGLLTRWLIRDPSVRITRNSGRPTQLDIDVRSHYHGLTRIMMSFLKERGISVSTFALDTTHRGDHVRVSYKLEIPQAILDFQVSWLEEDLVEAILVGEPAVSATSSFVAFGPDHRQVTYRCDISSLDLGDNPVNRIISICSERAQRLTSIWSARPLANSGSTHITPVRFVAGDHIIFLVRYPADFQTRASRFRSTSNPERWATIENNIAADIRNILGTARVDRIQ